MWTAAASLRVWMRSMPRPMVASKIDRIWLPESVKSWRTPAAARASTSRVAPVLMQKGRSFGSAAGDDRQELGQLLERRAIERGRRRPHTCRGDPAAAAQDLLAD